MEMATASTRRPGVQLATPRGAAPAGRPLHGALLGAVGLVSGAMVDLAAMLTAAGLAHQNRWVAGIFGGVLVGLAGLLGAWIAWTLRARPLAAGLAAAIVLGALAGFTVVAAAVGFAVLGPALQ